MLLLNGICCLAGAIMLTLVEAARARTLAAF